jgi:hypothetical protein
MGARTKLNIAAINGSLVIGAVAGLALESWSAFWGVTILLVVGNLCAGAIRPTGSRRR